MSERKQQRGEERLLNVNIGVLGHVDSGKTSLGSLLLQATARKREREFACVCVCLWLCSYVAVHLHLSLSLSARLQTHALAWQTHKYNALTQYQQP